MSISLSFNFFVDGGAVLCCAGGSPKLGVRDIEDNVAEDGNIQDLVLAWFLAWFRQAVVHGKWMLSVPMGQISFERIVLAS